MCETISNKELNEIEKWTLGRTIKELQELDNSDTKSYFSCGDYELLKSIKIVEIIMHMSAIQSLFMSKMKN